MMDIYLAASRLGKYPPLLTSTSVNNCSLLDINKVLLALNEQGDVSVLFQNLSSYNIAGFHMTSLKFKLQNH